MAGTGGQRGRRREELSCLEIKARALPEEWVWGRREGYVLANWKQDKGHPTTSSPWGPHTAQPPGKAFLLHATVWT